MLSKKFRYIFLVAFLVLISPICLFACNQVNDETLSLYKLDLVYNDEDKSLSGTENVTYFNNSENMFTSLYFHLYPNAFRQDAKNSVVSVANKDKAYPNGESYGDIEIQSVECDGVLLSYSIEGEDKNILKVDLQDELFPDESVIIDIEFKVTLPNINHRFGYGENTINFGNFYPIACVYEEGKGVIQELYHSNGDPFYSDCSNYEVKISYPQNMTLASSGIVTSTKEEGNQNISTIIGERIRDYAFVLSDKFDVVTKKTGNTLVKYYGYKGDTNLEESLQTSIDALNFFNEKFGVYPYSELSIVKSNFVHGGMEYPNLVLISDDVSGQKDYNYVIIHEIAHQWWYGVVGNDEYNNAWIDESLTEYSTLMFYRENKSYDEDFDALIKNALQSYKLFERVYIEITGKVDGRIDRGLDEFDTEPEYVQCIYTKGMLMFNSLEEMVGQKKFEKAIKSYYKTYSYKNVKPEEFIESFSKSTSYNLESFFDSWLNGKVAIQ